MATDEQLSDSDAMAAAWRENRRAAVTRHAQRLSRARDLEAARAAELIVEFMEQVNKRGISPQKLTARSRDVHRVRYRTSLIGWPLRNNGSAAVSHDGKFYYLSVDRSWSARIFGAKPEPSEPPLVLGKGGRDGESLDLQDALARVLDQLTT